MFTCFYVFNQNKTYRMCLWLYETLKERAHVLHSLNKFIVSCCKFFVLIFLIAKLYQTKKNESIKNLKSDDTFQSFIYLMLLVL